MNKSPANRELLDDRYLVEVLDEPVLHPGPHTLADAMTGRQTISQDGIVTTRKGEICLLARTNFSALTQITASRMPEPGTFATPREQAKHLPGTFLLASTVKNHFGHFIKECLGRLWALQAYPDIKQAVFFGEPAKKRFDPKAFHFIRDLYEMVGVTDLHLITEPTTVERLIVPRNDGRFFGEHGANQLFDQHARQLILSQCPRRDDAPLIYISRRAFVEKQGGTGGVLMEDLIEENLARAGYTIIAPETLSLREQISVYRSAKKVVAADISALHLYALVADSTQDVAIIARRDIAKRYYGPQFEALNLRHVFIECLEESYTLFWAPGNHIAKPFYVYQLDLHRVGRELIESGFIPEGSWRSPSPAEVAAAKDELRAESERRWAAAKAKGKV